MSSPPTRGSHQLSSRFSLFSLKTDDHLGRRRRRLLLLVDRPHQISWDVVPGAPPPSSWGLLSAHPAPIRSRKPGETKDQRQYLAACWPGPSTRQTVSHISPPLPRLCANLPLLLFLQAFPAFGFLLVWGGSGGRERTQKVVHPRTTARPPLSPPVRIGPLPFAPNLLLSTTPLFFFFDQRCLSPLAPPPPPAPPPHRLRRREGGCGVGAKGGRRINAKERRRRFDEERVGHNTTRKRRPSPSSA